MGMKDWQVRDEEALLAKRLGNEAKATWSEGRRRAGITRFIDKLSLRRVGEQARLLYREIDARDILKAVNELARDPAGQPYMIRDTAKRIEASRLELEHLDRKMRLREEENRPPQPTVAGPEGERVAEVPLPSKEMSPKRSGPKRKGPEA